ncbi:protein PLASTID MOVEMENT IMPAIRED 2 [Senna tora]|uniref:Protein PLASTID MOVEMENT IMPAIRED 2 n=1 Tax=Senna tora TaxID=362788 RepID=A0A834WBN4_9FABA|nr:protein PLASTID MOVEMENT IMPAIRED 2 [Senna tora]
MDMNGSEIDDRRRRVGSVKEAVNFYGERIADIRNPNSLKKTQMDSSVVCMYVCMFCLPACRSKAKPSSRGKELQKTKRHNNQSKERIWNSESFEHSNAKKTVKDLSSKIEESRSKTRELVLRKNQNYEYARVMRELEFVKKELHKLKLDVASVLKAKSRAEEEEKAARSKILSGSRTVEQLKKEIEEANDDQVLAELARIEALKELGEISVQRQNEENEFSSKMEVTRKKMKEATEELDESKDLEMKLAATMSDVDMLQNELNLVREMDDEPKDMSFLQNVTEELDAAKKELASIKEEGFQFMASIDVIRNELNHVTSETARLTKEEAKVESKVQNLSSKLLRAKSKLESVSKAEEKAKSIVNSLSLSLEELEAETEAARKEKDTITQEVTTTKEEIKKTELEIDMTEEKLQSAMQELEVIKSSESEALEKLKILSENAMRERALAAKHSPLITISKFEYEYLTNHAAVAEEIADRKVQAARGWIEALRASEKEILVRTKIAEREIKEKRIEEEIIDQVTEKRKMVSKRYSREGLENLSRKREKSSGNYVHRTGSRKSMKLSNGTMVATKQAKFQKSASPAGRQVSPFTIKKKKKVIPSLASFFKGKRNTRNSYKREREKKQKDLYEAA